MTEPSATHEPPAPAMTPRAGPPAAALEGIPHPDPFVCELHVAPHEVSSAIDHVSNVEYLRWLDRAAELHSDHLGYTRRRMLDDGSMWFVARHEIDYRIIRPTDATEVCRAATLWVYVDLARRRPVRVPAAMVRAFEPLVVRGRRGDEADH